MIPPQRWFIRHHGKVTEVDSAEYVAAAKRGDSMGITTFDGSGATWDDFNRFLSRALGETDESVAHGKTPSFGVRDRYPPGSRPVKRDPQTARPLAVTGAKEREMDMPSLFDPEDVPA